MSFPQLYFIRQELCDRAAVPEDVLRYWLRAGLIRPEHGGGKGKHWRFTRLELGVAVLLAELHRLGLSSTALSDLAAGLHASIEWMRERRIDIEQAGQIDELIEARTSAGDVSPEGWSEIVAARAADDWFDLPPSLVRLAGSMDPSEWRLHYARLDLLADVSIRRCPARATDVWLARSTDGTWVIDPPDVSQTAVRLSVVSLNERAWSGERD